MRQNDIIASLSSRVRPGPNLALLTLVGGIFCLFRLVVVDAPRPGSLELVLPFILLFAHLAFSPIPWQWTGDDAPRAGLGRGFLQSLVFNSVWVTALMLLLYLLIGAPGEINLSRPVLPPPGLSSARGLPYRDFSLLGIVLINLPFATAFGWVFAEKEATEARERMTVELLRQARSRSLQNQLEPHVLYNALSSLSELVYEDPLAAEEVITRLADLYRMLTVHGNADRIPLGEERRLVEAYLAMEQMRLGERLTVQWDWPAEADSIQVPPLFLQPLVENAIKHGISPSDQGGAVVISCMRTESVMSLIVENTGRPLIEGGPKGVGLSNIEARLQLWAEASATFTLRSQGGWTVARIQWTEGAGA